MRDGGEEEKNHTGCFLHALSYCRHHGIRLFRNVQFNARALAHRPWDKLQLPSVSADKENPPIGMGEEWRSAWEIVASSVFPN